MSITEGVVEIVHSNTSALMTITVYGFARHVGYGHPGGRLLHKITGEYSGIVKIRLKYIMLLHSPIIFSSNFFCFTYYCSRRRQQCKMLLAMTAHCSKSDLDCIEIKIL